MKQCPKCETELTPKSIGPVEVDECQSCKGFWFDKDELRQAKDATDSDLNWMDFEIWKHEKEFSSSPSPLHCPGCQEAMVSLEYGHSAVVVDYCTSCRGTWLDREEFKKIIDSLNEELVTKSFSGYIKEAVKDGCELLVGPETFISEWKDLATVLRLMQYRLFVESPALLNAVTDAQNIVQ